MRWALCATLLLALCGGAVEIPRRARPHANPKPGGDGFLEWLRRRSKSSSSSSGAGDAGRSAWGGRNGDGGYGEAAALSMATVGVAPFTPQLLPKDGRRFFQGYYLRLVDHAKSTTLAVVLGSFRRDRDAKRAPRDGEHLYDEHYVCVMVNGRTFHHFVPRGEGKYLLMQDVEEVPSERSASFRWSAPGVGEFRVEGDAGSVDLSIPGVDVRVRFNQRVPWGGGRESGEGPEGWLGQTPFLPCHYFVYTMGSQASYAVRLRSWAPGPELPYAILQEQQGTGYLHLEANYGSNFPSGWVWIQGVSQDGSARFISVGGNFVIAGIETRTWLTAFRSPDFNATFRTTDGDRFFGVEYSREAGFARFSAESRWPLKRHQAARMHVAARTNAAAFGESIYVPTPGGFSREPGCQEAHDAVLSITFEHVGKSKKAKDAPGHGAPYNTTHIFSLAALEFGGKLLYT